MFHIKSNSVFLLKHLNFLLLQKKFPILNEDLYDLTINIEPNSKKFNLTINGLEEKFSLPINFNSLFTSIFNILSNSYVQLNDLVFFPLKSMAEYKDKKTILRNNHSIILNELIKNKDFGIKKRDLYFLIWPNDYEIQLNKLDTHLTNLKNYLKFELNFSLNYFSSSGIIRLT